VARWLAQPARPSSGGPGEVNDGNADDDAAPHDRPQPSADWYAQHGIEPPQNFSHADTPAATDPEDHACNSPPDIWPDNALTVRVFCAMQTQWQVGMGGAVGLVYASLPRVEQALAVPADQASDVFFGVQLMERETLRVWAAQATKKQVA
jgi:hypothetical protein